MIEKIDGYLRTRLIDHRNILVRSFLAAKTVDLFDYIRSIQRYIDSEAYVVHIGTYDLRAYKTPNETCSEILLLIKELKADKNKQPSQMLFRGSILMMQS